MRPRKVIFIIFFLLAIGWTGLMAQSAVVVSGGNISGDGGSASYTVGQIAFVFIEGDSVNISPGIQVEVSKVKLFLSLSCSLFPNPANESITLKIEDFSRQNLRYFLSDQTGKLILSGYITEAETIVPLYNLAAATYFLTVTNERNQVKTFKIIKNR